MTFFCYYDIVILYIYTKLKIFILFNFSNVSFLKFLQTGQKSTKSIFSAIFILEGLVEFTSLIYIFGRFYKGLIFTKLLFDQLPLFNPYKWPLSMVRIITEPWFRFWRKYFPPARLGKHGFDISGLIAFETFELLLKSVSFLKLLLLIRLEKLFSLIN